MKDALWIAVSFALIAIVACAWFWFSAPTYAGEVCHGRSGIASWYGYTGRPTASGETFHPDGLSAAMIGVPFGSHVRVTVVATGRSVVVTINDTGGFRKYGRLIDLSRGAAARLGIIRAGTARVCLTAR